MKTIIQKSVMYSLSAGFNWSNLRSLRWRVYTYIKLSVTIVLMEGYDSVSTDQNLWHLQILIWKGQTVVNREQSHEARLWVWWWKIRMTNQLFRRMCGRLDTIRIQQILYLNKPKVYPEVYERNVMWSSVSDISKAVRIVIFPESMVSLILFVSL